MSPGPAGHVVGFIALPPVVLSLVVALTGHADWIPSVLVACAWVVVANRVVTRVWR